LHEKRGYQVKIRVREVDGQTREAAIQSGTIFVYTTGYITMKKEEIAVNALVFTARNDMKKGLTKQQILRSLSLFVNHEMLKKVWEKL
jgi:hypothetical protein